MNQDDFEGRNQNVMPRRNFFGRLMGGAALGLSGLVTNAWAETKLPDEPEMVWPGKLEARHKQLFDAYEIYGGVPLLFAYNYLRTSKNSTTAVIIFRYLALPLAMNHMIWEKYKIGETYKIIDPETKAPAVKNPYYQAKDGVLKNDNISIDRMMKRNTIFGACALALIWHGSRLAVNAGVTEHIAQEEWTANMIPGISLIPSGSWGVNRAQEAGCTYCTGGNGIDTDV